jgi:hypothetical protein
MACAGSFLAFFRKRGRACSSNNRYNSDHALQTEANPLRITERNLTTSPHVHNVHSNSNSNAGNSEVLAQTIRKPRDKQQLSVALKALCNVAPEAGESHRLRFCEAGGLAAVCAVLKHQSSLETATLGVRALCYLAVDERCRHAIVAANGIRVLFEVWEEFRGEQLLHVEISRAIRNLSVDEGTRQKISESTKHIKSMVIMMKEGRHHIPLQEEMSVVFANFATHHNCKLALACTEGSAVECVLKGMAFNASCASVQEKGCFFLCNFCDIPQTQMSISQAGAVNIVIDAMRNHPEHLGVQQEGVRALANLAAGSDVNQQSICQLGGIYLVMKAV